MPRSTRVHPDYQPAVAIALERNGFTTQGDLAAHLEIALSTVSNFCRGVNVSIAKFEQICEALGLDKRAIMGPPKAPKGDPTEKTTEPPSFFAYDQAWVGREVICQELTTQLNGSCRLLLIAGIAGIGKTALAERLLLACQEHKGQGQASRPAFTLLRENFDNPDQASDFASVAARLLTACGQAVTPEDRQSGDRLRNRLLRHLQDHPCFLIFDSLEQILEGNEQDGWSRFKDEAFLPFFQGLLAANDSQSQLILTSQELPQQLSQLGSRYPNFWQFHPLSGLSPTEQLELFEKTGLKPKPTAQRKLLQRIGKAYDGHPLALRIIAGEMGSKPYYGDVSAYWTRYGSEIEAVEQALAEAAAGQVAGAEDRWQLDRFSRKLRQSVRTRLEATLARLRQDYENAYVLLCEASIYRCAVPESFWLSHLEYLDLEREAEQLILDALLDRFLVEEQVEQGQYQLKQHNLIRSVALEHLESL